MNPFVMVEITLFENCNPKSSGMNLTYQSYVNKYLHCIYASCTVNIFCSNLIQFFFKIYFKIIYKKKECTTHELPALVLPGNTDSPITLVL